MCPVRFAAQPALRQQPGADGRQADTHQTADADAPHYPGSRGRDEERQQGQRQEPDSDLERRVPEHILDTERDERGV